MNKFSKEEMDKLQHSLWKMANVLEALVYKYAQEFPFDSEISAAIYVARHVKR